MYTVRSPVLFLVFNRPEATRKVFDEIRKAKPQRLYIAADGPRRGNDTDALKCVSVREIVERVDWPCELQTLFNEDNKGCKEAVSAGISWFFAREEEGIVLEDDCLPHTDFFRFCDTLLEKYRADTRVRMICGCNLHEGTKWGEASYFFSKLTHVWGWASWRRVWDDYDKELAHYHEPEAHQQFLKVFDEPLAALEWSRIFSQLKRNQIDTWDFQLAITNFFNNGLSIISNVNLISNIGFGESATHTFDPKSKFAAIPLEALGDITHPRYMLPEKLADLHMLDQDFNINAKKKKSRSLKSRIKRFFKSL